ncbi:uncharacterized protein MELLADRAFT_111336 [Melampsora larici-populina 98AG31]|uniref:Uncharacterized protein n=1 Tax=Melampsora larici-populina (strain 98AG31 / pathotype 3-4-7) TaxID=747676 RepID=F4S2T8_MELLP|nr:uncharacterized protein MELLADRAFT_111336 [Melampsora larici-populina 98AG31]EGG01071.1 hypothetical protein MELLADRAFT_111336 [Melampsora larici-populina 98AG31]
MFPSIDVFPSSAMLPGLGGSLYQSKYTKSTRRPSPPVNQNPQLSSAPRSFSGANQVRIGDRRPRVPFARKEETPRAVFFCDAQEEVEESSSSGRDTIQAPQSSSHELLTKIEEKETRIRHLETEFALAQDRIHYLESRNNMAWNRVEAMEKAVREFESTLLTPTCCVPCALERVKGQCDDLLRFRGGEGDCLLCLESGGGEPRDESGSMVPTVEAEATKPAALLPSLESSLDSGSRRIHEPQEPIYPMASPSYRFPPPASEPTSEDIFLPASSSYTFPEPSTELSSEDRLESAHTPPTSSVSMPLPPLELPIPEEISHPEISWVLLDSTDGADMMLLNYGQQVGHGWRRSGIRSSSFPEGQLGQRTGIRKRDQEEEAARDDVGLDHVGKRARTVC